MTLQAPPWRTGQEAVTRGKTNHFLIQSAGPRATKADKLTGRGVPTSIGALSV